MTEERIHHRDRMRRLASLVAVAALVVSLCGCGRKDKEAEAQAVTAPAQVPGEVPAIPSLPRTVPEEQDPDAPSAPIPLESVVQWRIRPETAVLTVSRGTYRNTVTTETGLVSMPVSLGFYTVEVESPGYFSWKRRMSLGGASTNHMVSLDPIPVSNLPESIPLPFVQQEEVSAETSGTTAEETGGEDATEEPPQAGPMLLTLDDIVADMAKESPESPPAAQPPSEPVTPEAQPVEQPESEPATPEAVVTENPEPEPATPEAVATETPESEPATPVPMPVEPPTQEPEVQEPEQTDSVLSEQVENAPAPVEPVVASVDSPLADLPPLPDLPALPTSELEPEPAVDAVPSSETESDAVPPSEPESEPTPVVDAVPTNVESLDVLLDEPLPPAALVSDELPPEPVTEPAVMPDTPEPVTEPVTEPAVVPDTPEPVTEPVSEPAVVPDTPEPESPESKIQSIDELPDPVLPDTALVLEPEPVPESTPEPAPMPEEEPDISEPVPETESVPTAEPVPTVEPVPETEPVPTAEPVPVADPVPAAASVPVAEEVHEAPQYVRILVESTDAADSKIVSVAKTLFAGKDVHNVPGVTTVLNYADVANRSLSLRVRDYIVSEPMLFQGGTLTPLSDVAVSAASDGITTIVFQVTPEPAVFQFPNLDEKAELWDADGVHRLDYDTSTRTLKGCAPFDTTRAQIRRRGYRPQPIELPALGPAAKGVCDETPLPLLLYGRPGDRCVLDLGQGCDLVLIRVAGGLVPASVGSQEVRVRDFWMTERPVTLRQWTALLDGVFEGENGDAMVAATPELFEQFKKAFLSANPNLTVGLPLRSELLLAQQAKIPEVRADAELSFPSATNALPSVAEGAFHAVFSVRRRTLEP